MTTTWADLNERQQEYRKILYETDQIQEQNERKRAAMDRYSRPADQWRYMEYADTYTGHTPLKRRLVEKGLVDPGTGSTFEALEKRGLILVRYHGTVEIRLTTKGRKLVREALGLKVPKELPVGTLREWHWKALVEAWKAGDEGVRESASKGISWNTWLRLRDYTFRGEEKPLVAERKYYGETKQIAIGYTQNYVMRMCITEFGKEYYKENWARYREMYPDVDAPEPEEG